MRNFVCRIFTCLLSAIAVCTFPYHAAAQSVSFEAATQEMLSKNFDIRIVANEREISSEFNNIGTAGFLPTVDAAFGYEKSFNNTSQKYFNGQERDANNAQSDVLSAGVILNWTLFDGCRMFANKNILESNEALGGYYLRGASEEALMMLANLYYQIVQRKELLAVLQTSLQLSKERYRLAVKRKDVGSASLQEVLQAEIDLNSDSVLLLNQETEIANLKIELSLLLARSLVETIDVSDTIPMDTTLVLDAFLQSAGTANIDLLIARENIRLAQYEVNRARSWFYPEAGVYAGFDYSKTNNDVGILQTNQTFGPSVGFYVNFNLFNGLRDYKNLNVAKILQENSAISGEQAAQTNQALVLKAFRNYELAMKVLKIERANIEKAKQNVTIALKRFELGDINAVEFREIQLQALRAESRYLLSQYEIRINGLELKRLAGVLQL